MLFVGSCFAANIGQRFVDNKFRAVVNPYGVMYNPASILHTVEKVVREGTFVPRIVFFTLGTNHVYRLKETGEIVDNCLKRPARLFQEEELSVDDCADYIMQAVRLLLSVNPDVHIVLTVSPIRYAKYGYHKSQLSKATLLLAAEKCITNSTLSCLHYFPSYEIVNDELRDYRFYKEDMLHPSDQTVSYIWERLSSLYFSAATNVFLNRWRPIREALGHKPFNPDSEEHKLFVQRTQQKIADLKKDYPLLDV